ncbi:hypothetical protein [Amycolatopsis benzoatilytica]|uniref:hypothetical protein n=1 Tax=Amycolatopsis benzoatilytica TaxID=346045 RepID=UPI0005515285|nr:hypothetical protein [Amycolatopsis benzoatilytica]
MANQRIPDQATVEAAVAAALRAPAADGLPPAQWRIGHSALHLYAGRTGIPDDRAPVLSGGAALHHFRARLAGSGWATSVARLPQAGEPGHLAAVTPRPGQPSGEELALAAAILVRRDDWRPRRGWPVPPSVLLGMAQAAAGAGTLLHEVTDREVRARLLPRLGLTARHRTRERVLVGGGGLAKRPPARRGGEVATLVLSTAEDDQLAWLRAGEALSAVLLKATAYGLASGSSVTVARQARELLTDRVTAGRVPQAVLWVGWPEAGEPPGDRLVRAEVAEVLCPLEAPSRYHFR